jgi:Amt family ammonium transporter
MDIVFDVWLLIGTAMVFFMQCGFAMVETGFTRAKNAGNIIMKNLMDFCIGTVVFILLGFSLMCSEDYLYGIIGIPNLNIFTDYTNYNCASFVFNLVFCATASTIVSGAMAERTKFSAYCIYSAIISAILYPVEAGWIWNSNGWLAQMGFVDYAGSAAIHTMGGVTALVGAIFLGPRIGKYQRNTKGKVVKVRAIPGHALPLGALGCFILWFGWYGFNGAAANSFDELSSIFLTTTIAPALSTCATLIYTWIRNGKPDVSLCLNASLAGLVAITAPCASVNALGAVAIGLVAGVLLPVVVEVLDLKLHIDDPVGAVAVHGACGVWGTLSVGLFSMDGGLFYDGGIHQLGVQAIGVISVAIWTAVTATITFATVKKFHGLRVEVSEEISGLDSVEHGLLSAYADFAPAVSYRDHNLLLGAPNLSTVSVENAVQLEVHPSFHEETAPGGKLTKVEIFTRQEAFPVLKECLMEIGITGMTVTNVLGCGIQKGKPEYYYRGVAQELILLPRMQVEVIVGKVPVQQVIETAKRALYTGHYGDGKIFVYNVENVIKIRTGEEGYNALQDEDGEDDV